MIKEKSCGAVVYKQINSEFLFLLERMTHGHISMPKGHIETGESEADTALREIKEETNLNVNLDTGFRHIISYSPCEGHIKIDLFSKKPSAQLFCAEGFYLLYDRLVNI